MKYVFKRAEPPVIYICLRNLVSKCVRSLILMDWQDWSWSALILNQHEPFVVLRKEEKHTERATTATKNKNIALNDWTH